MIEWMIAAPSSGSGKTTVCAALITLLRRRGLRTAAFKCGPDYLDPTFHHTDKSITGCNLDLFLASEDKVRALYRRYSAGCDAAVTEGVMGFYDGVGGTTDRAGSWHTAVTLGLPVLLVLRPKGASLTLAAELRGLQSFRRDSRIRALFLADTSPRYAERLAPMLEAETGLPVLGSLPHLEGASLPSRHLGLLPAEELADREAVLNRLADALEQNTDLDRLFSLGVRSGPKEAFVREALPPVRARVACARDEAFGFCYPETLDAFREAGIEPVFFSPLRDGRLPENCGGLYLPGGYPEVYAEELFQNRAMRDAVSAAVRSGMPCAAECGGCLYLGQALEGTDGKLRPMCGVLPGTAHRTPRPVRFGYAELTAKEDSLLFRAGEKLPVHEFHYWESDAPGSAMTAEKPVTGQSWECCYASPTLYAGFPHLYFADAPEAVRRFGDAAERFSAAAL